jgi:hypothetical protein
MKNRRTAGIVVGAVALGALVGVVQTIVEPRPDSTQESGKPARLDNSVSDTVLSARSLSGAASETPSKTRTTDTQGDKPTNAAVKDGHEPGEGEFKNTEWGGTCAAVDAKERNRRDQRLGSLLSNFAGSELSDPFSGTISSLYVEYQQAGRWHQLRLAVADADAAQQTASYKFVLSARTGPSPESPFQFIPLAKGLEGSFDQEAAKERWNSAVAQLKSNAEIEILTIRSRSFARFFDGEAVEIENNRVAVYDDSSFQCIGQGDGLPFRCSCTPDFASLD